MPLNILVGNIVDMDTDAIVNAANSRLKEGDGVCGAIFNAANDERLQRDCDLLAPIEVGEAIITAGYNLKAKYIIHTVGPIWKDGKSNEEEKLKAAYLNSLNLAIENNLGSISFPLISAGIFGYPKDEALEVALSTIKEFLVDNELNVNLVLYNRTKVSRRTRLLNEIDNYINEHYTGDDSLIYSEREILLEKSFKLEVPRRLEDLLNQSGESFQEMLFRLIDEKGYSDVEVYKRSNIDRKLFSKIRNIDYSPNKKTVLALSIGMRLNADECEDLLKKLGYSLSTDIKQDVVVKYFIDSEIYDIYKVNEVLFDLNIPTL